MSAPHALQRRLLAEELVRRRRADEAERYAASQRRGRIDANPHQIDAVIFALRRVREGGCILADEVGLGKTIEAGLVVAQLLAEGARRVLLIVPKPLLGQWQAELFGLFGIELRPPGDFDGEGVFALGRELAGSERGALLLRAAEPFDLCVIDEAHEVFAGIYRRYDRHGRYDEEADLARVAGRVRALLGATPVLLLTATPIQNSLAELWGLVQYVEPSGTLLGSLPTFRRIFCDGDDRALVPAQAHELRRRIASVCQRTLRRQAQEFLEHPFVERSALLYEYSMSPAERSLYDDVSTWLLERDSCAFHGRARRLLLLSFHRLMASSQRALAASLRRVAARLDALLEGHAPDDGSALARDLEDEDALANAGADEGADDERDAPPSHERVRAERERVIAFAERAESLADDAKADALTDAVRMAIERGARGAGSGKVVVFTESLTTQDYLAERLGARVVAPGEVTCFRGVNDSPRAKAALARWQAEVGDNLPPHARPPRDVAQRLALVHEFATRARVLVSTEAGAKGLNLQFADTVVNYDLPWNPQRIEQRIGRCHRYGQTRAVTVVNFLARDNEAQRLILAILGEKLELFGTVLDASDNVLHEPGGASPETLAGALGTDLETRLARIWEGARSLAEVERELVRLRESIDERRRAFENALERTVGLIETRLDAGVRKAFAHLRDTLPASLARLDGDLERLVTGFLAARAIPHERREREGAVELAIAPAAGLPAGLEAGLTVGVGRPQALGGADPLHLAHPLVRAAVDEARAATAAPLRLVFRVGSDAPAALLARRGRRAQLALTRVAYAGFEPVERLVVTALFEGEDAPLEASLARALVALAVVDEPGLGARALAADALDDAVEEMLFLDRAAVASDEAERFERALEQLERWLDDQALVLRRERRELAERLAEAVVRREGALGSEARERAERAVLELGAELEACDVELARLASRDDPHYARWRAEARARRFAPPRATRLVEAELVLA